MADAVRTGWLRRDTDDRVLARLTELTSNGSFLSWTLFRQGSAADQFRRDCHTQ